MTITGAPAAGGTFGPDGTMVHFTATGGSVSPEYVGTKNGIATTTFTPSGAGTATITATVDDQSVTVPVTVTTPDCRHERDEHRHRPGDTRERSMPAWTGRASTGARQRRLWTGATTRPAQ